jgi:hypothetical protein
MLSALVASGLTLLEDEGTTPSERWELLAQRRYVAPRKPEYLHYFVVT